MRPRHLQTLTPEQIIGFYGQDAARGVLSDHVETFLQVGGQVREAASGSGRRWAVVEGLAAVPVVCSEIIQVDTEDGPMSGRCGLPSVEHGACERHAEAIASWLDLGQNEEHWGWQAG